MSLPEPTFFRGREPKAVDHSFQMLWCIAQAGPYGVTARELSQRLRMPRATTYRILKHLIAEEYVVRGPDLAVLLLGARVVEFAWLVTEGARTAAPELPGPGHGGAEC